MTQIGTIFNSNSASYIFSKSFASNWVSHFWWQRSTFFMWNQTLLYKSNCVLSVIFSILGKLFSKWLSNVVENQLILLIYVITSHFFFKKSFNIIYQMFRVKCCKRESFTRFWDNEIQYYFKIEEHILGAVSRHLGKKIYHE